MHWPPASAASGAVLATGSSLSTPSKRIVPRDPLLRRSVCAAGQPARPQVSQPIGLSGSDREFPVLTGRSGTQRARRIRSGP
jgi:hypothetical protein